MSFLLNHRFYCLLNNSIKRRKVNSLFIAINSNEVNHQKRRFINTNKFDDKKAETKSGVKHFETSMNKKLRNKAEIGTNSRGLLKTLDADEMAFKITVTEMKRFLEKNGIKVSTGRTCLSIDCPFCASKANQLNSINNSIDSKLFINKKTSNYICYSCEISGNWISFAELISNLKSSRKSSKQESLLLKPNTNLFGDHSLEKLLKPILDKSITIDDLTEDQFNSLINTFGLNDLTKSSLKYFEVRVSKDLNQLILPFKSCYDKNKITSLKVIELREESGRMDSDRYIEKVIPNDTKLSIFGLNQHLSRASSADHLVITDSPIDAIAVTQETNIPSISLPFKGMSSQLRPEVLPFFEGFKKVNICLVGGCKTFMPSMNSSLNYYYYTV